MKSTLPDDVENPKLVRQRRSRCSSLTVTALPNRRSASVHRIFCHTSNHNLASSTVTINKSRTTNRRIPLLDGTNLQRPTFYDGLGQAIHSIHLIKLPAAQLLTRILLG
jgi:hypothetical protein